MPKPVPASLSAPSALALESNAKVPEPEAVSPRGTLLEERIPFRSGDGLECDLVRVRSASGAARGPLLLVHGAGVRANIFRAPIPTDFVRYLVHHGYDVWLENWRASIDLPPNQWTLDQAAVFDHPAAVRTIVERTGWDRIKAVIHCQGSTSFTMAAMAGLVPEVRTIVTNAVSLHPVVPPWSRMKLRFAVPLLSSLTEYLNPAWGIHAPTRIAKLIRILVTLTHYECDNPVCKLVSFTYGSGAPALWSHLNLNPETHEWLKQEFAHVPLSFFRQMARCVQVGHLVPVDGLHELPKDFAAGPPLTDARFVFLAGQDNLCFLPESQRRSFAFFNHHRPRYHALHVLPGYRHLDVFMGQRAAEDVFPLLLRELNHSA
jgi:hypothetical protein